MTSKLKILFLCTGNSCRSQMAEGWARALKGGEIETFSAGVHPQGLNPLAVRAMHEVGVDIARQRSKHVDELNDITFDYVITVCGSAHERCPMFPGTTKVIHAGFDDPPRLAANARGDEEAMPHYRRVRDEIKAFVETLPGRASGDAMNKYLAEMIGTFALVFAGTGAIVINDVSNGAVTHVGVSLTFGLVVMAMIYAVGDVSGAHLNPAVTIGFWIARRLPARLVAPYVTSQLIGAFAASTLILLLFGNRARLGATLPSGAAAQSFALELVLTAILMFVILCVSTGPKEVGVVAGVAVGGVIGLEALFAGPICGASMNPARSLAPAIVGGHLSSVWIYLVAPVIGAALSVPLWRYTRVPAIEAGA